MEMKEQVLEQKKKRLRSDTHTFVVCAYKESPYLEECICSLVSQSVESRIIIITSTPNQHIFSIAETYQLPVVINENGGGLAEDWNFAVDQAQTPYVTLAHQDDVYCKQYTEAVLRTLDSCCCPLIAFTDYCELREGKTVENNKLLSIKRLLLSPLKFRSLWGNKFIRRRILSLGSAICCPSVTLAKDHLSCPIFSNNLKSNIDWQAWEKISKMNGEFAYVPKRLVKHRIHQASTTSQILEDDIRKQEDLVVFCKFWPEPIAKIIEHFYKKGEKSNQLEGHQR